MARLTLAAALTDLVKFFRCFEASSFGLAALIRLLTLPARRPIAVFIDVLL